MTIHSFTIDRLSPLPFQIDDPQRIIPPAPVALRGRRCIVNPGTED